MKEIELKQIDHWQAFKVLIIMIAICLLLFGLIVSFYGLTIGGFKVFFKGLIGTLLITVTFAPFYAFIATIVIMFYNFIARMIGGLKITLNIEEK